VTPGTVENKKVQNGNDIIKCRFLCVPIIEYQQQHPNDIKIGIAILPGRQRAQNQTHREVQQ
jgi:hypothetical protein